MPSLDSTGSCAQSAVCGVHMLMRVLEPGSSRYCCPGHSCEVWTGFFHAEWRLYACQTHVLPCPCTLELESHSLHYSQALPTTVQQTTYYMQYVIACNMLLSISSSLLFACFYFVHRQSLERVLFLTFWRRFRTAST